MVLRKSGVYFSFLCLFILSFIKGNEPTPYEFPDLKYFPKMPESPVNPVTKEGVRLGRYLFYDPVLSIDSSMSCASCHKQQSAFSDSPYSLSKGRNGVLMKRNTMALFNLAWYPSFFWDGRASSIEDQVFHPVRAENEMNLQWNIASARLERSAFYKSLFMRAFGNQPVDSILITRAVAQFLRTLISYRSKYDKVLSGDAFFTKDEHDGLMLVNDQTRGDCIHCHITDGNVLATVLTFSNNGLDSVSDPNDYKDKGRGPVTGKLTDYGKFIIPSLRNVAFTAPYMHDGRFKTLNDVLEFYSSGVKQGVNIDSKMEYVHQGGVKLSGEEKKKIISFLLTLSDSSFIADPEFGNPFVAR